MSEQNGRALARHCGETQNSKRPIDCEIERPEGTWEGPREGTKGGGRVHQIAHSAGLSEDCSWSGTLSCHCSRLVGAFQSMQLVTTDEDEKMEAAAATGGCDDDRVVMGGPWHLVCFCIQRDLPVDPAEHRCRAARQTRHRHRR